MSREFPLLDGTVIDMDDVVDTHPLVGDATAERDKIILDTQFAKEELPWWLSYQKDNASSPSDPTFSGLSSNNGKGTVKIETLDVNDGDMVWLEGPTLDYRNWSSIRFYVAMDSITEFAAMNLGDDPDSDALQNGFGYAITGSTYYKLLDGGSGESGSWRNHVALGGSDAPAVWGFRIENHGMNSGYQFTTLSDVSFAKAFDEDYHSFPSAGDLTFHIGAKKTNNSGSCTISRVYLELVP